MSATTSSSRHQRAKAMMALTEEYLSEPGITLRAFCARHQISCSTFHYHLAKHRRQQVPAPEKPCGRFIALTVPDMSNASGGPSGCEIAWPDGVVIRFKTNPSPEYLLALIQAGSVWS